MLAEPTNHRPKDKPGHGSLVAQVGGYGEEHLPCHLITTLKANTDERKKKYHHDGRTRQYHHADRYSQCVDVRAGTCRAVRGNCPDSPCRNQSCLQKRSSERVRHEALSAFGERLRAGRLQF